MKILFVIDSLGSGGAQRQLVEIAKGFKAKGCAISFLVYHEENFFRDELDKLNIQISCILEPNYIRRLFKMRTFIRKGNFDGVLSFLEAANFICEFAGIPRRRWKLVVGERSANPNILRSLKLRFYRWFHIFADYVVSNSWENIKLVRRVNPLLPQRKCRVIYNIVDLDVWRMNSKYEPRKNNIFHLIVAASHHYIKNAKGLIDAVKNLEDSKKSELQIIWYGDESPDDSLNDAKELVREYSLDTIFTFHKASKSIHHKMSDADAVGLFSYHEGLPNVLCEGIALGKPIIASYISDIPLLVKNRKLLFNPHNAQDIKSSLSYLLSLNKAELLEIGRQNREENIHLFAKKAIIGEYLKLLTETI